MGGEENTENINNTHIGGKKGNPTMTARGFSHTSKNFKTFFCFLFPDPFPFQNPAS